MTPTMLATEENKQKLEMLIATFFNRLHGYHVQYNIVSERLCWMRRPIRTSTKTSSYVLLATVRSSTSCPKQPGMISLAARNRSSKISFP